MKYDPVDAFFSGLFYGPMRVLFGLVTMWVVFVSCFMTGSEFDLEVGGLISAFLGIALISSMGLIFYWGEYGMWVILGMFLLVAQWGAFYAFIVSEDTKIWWFLLLSFSTGFCLPVAFDGPWWIIICVFAVLSFFYWLPELIAVCKK